MAISQNGIIYYSDVLDTLDFYNIPRRTPKDITSYWQNGTLWNRINGTNGYQIYEDIHVGDYIDMGRTVTCPNSYNNTVGSQYVTIASCGGFYGKGDSNEYIVNYNHLIMIPGKGFGGTQHFGRYKMNDSSTTTGAYKNSKMNKNTIGSVVSTVSVTSGATINQQLYYIFGNHLKTYESFLSNSVDTTGYNRRGKGGGCSDGRSWTPIQARLMGEIEVYGSIVWSSSGHDTGDGLRQIDLFRHNREAINNGKTAYWLKDVASATEFCRCNYSGTADCYGAGESGYGVRPCFILAS